MLLKTAFGLLMAWLLGVVGLYRVPDLVHVAASWSVRCSFYCGRSRLATLPQLVEGMSDHANHDHSARQLRQVRATMSDDTTATTAIPRALESYPSANQTLAADLAMRVQIEPFNAIATGVFLLGDSPYVRGSALRPSRTPRAAPAR